MRILLTALAVAYATGRHPIRILLTVTAVAVAYVTGHGWAGMFAVQHLALLAVLAYSWASALITSGSNSAKTRNIETRLNAAMPRIPWPQNNPGGAGNNSYGASNSSYGPGNSSYTSGNASYPVGGGTVGLGAVDNRWSSNQGSGTVNPWAHAHIIDHSHSYGQLATDFNVLRNAYSDTVSAFNAHIGDHGALVTTVGALRQSHSDMITAYNALRTDHSNLITSHNDIVNRLANANILQ